MGLKPVLFIDEVNYIYRYLDSKEIGKEIIGKIMDFLVQITKQRKNLLAYSSSMFIKRILDTAINRASVFVVGDMGKEDAQVFWETYLP